MEPKNKRQFKSRAYRCFLNANPDADNITFTWTHCERVTWPGDGTQGWSGVATVSATGYRTRKVIATWHVQHGLSVR